MQHPKLSLWTISWPIFIEFSLIYAVFFADTFFLSQISDEIAGTIGSLFPVIAVAALCLLMMAQAGTSVASQYIGGKHFEMVPFTYMIMLTLNVFLGSILFILFRFNSSNIGIWMGFTDDMNTHSEVYLEIIAFVWLVWGIRFSYAAILASRGLTYWNMWIAIILNITNIGFNYIFLNGLFGIPKMGVIGIALASILSGVVAVLICVYLVHIKLDIRFQWEIFFKKFKEIIIPILRIGIPSILEPVTFNICQVVVTIMVVKLGDIEMGTKAFTTNIMIMGMTWGIALATGNQIIVAHLMGAKKYNEVNRCVYKSLFLTVGGSFFISSIIYLFATPLLRIFTNNSEIIKLGSTVLLIGILIDPFRSANMLFGNALKGCGDAKVAPYLGMGVMVFLFLPLAYFLGIQWGYGLIGIWFALLIDQIIRCVIYYERWNTRKWEKLGITNETN